VLLNPIIRAQIATLIIATSIVQFANGFFGTLISLRVALEDFDATIASLVLSSYFAGLQSVLLLVGGSSSDTDIYVSMPPSLKWS
jgi:hypothetical protein